MPVWYDITCRHEPGTGPDGILARLLNELTRHPASVSQLVPRLLREIRLALCAQAVQYFRRSDDGDYLIVEAADSRDPNDTLELAQQAHPLTPDGIPIYRAFWDDCEGVRGPALVNFTDPAVRARLIPASVPWHDRFGARWGLCCPLFADARAVGFLGVRTDDPAGFAEPVRAAVQRLADQLALAVTIERLTRQVVEAADLRARQAEAERRAAEAKRISDFLVRTAGGLAGGADLSAVLERIVVGLAETLDAAHVFLFRHDPATNLIRLHVSAIDGVYRGGPSGAEVPLWAAPFPADISPAWRLMCERRGLYTPDMCPIPAEEFAWPGVLDYAARFELSDMGHMVLFCGDVPVGSMGLAFRHGRKLTPADKPFVEAVADQAAVALRLLDVAETEQEAAVAKERQAGLVREGQLLKAVAAAAEALTRGPDLSTACAEACRALGEATGVDRMGVLRYDPATSGVFLFAEWTRNGFPRWAEVNPNPLRETEYPEVYQILLAGEVYTSPLREKTGANRELNDRLQTITDLLVPVFVSGRFWGVLSFDDCTIERHWTAGEVAVLRTAAEALAAAVRREKLEREKTEVVAQERQAAAEQRAAELAAVNATLARSLSAASGSTDFEQILDVVFREVVRAAAAPAGLLFTYDPIANTLTTQTWVDESGSGRGCCPGAPPLLAGPFDADVTPGFRQFVQAKRILGVVDLKNPPPEVQDLLWSGVTDWHLAHGRVAACTIPVMCGEQPLGVIGLAWHTNVQFSQLQSELLFALTNQVAIVLQLSDVAAARRAAVVAQERQAAAEASAEQLARRDQLLTAAARCA